MSLNLDNPFNEKYIREEMMGLSLVLHSYLLQVGKLILFVLEFVR